ncbi:MAG: hypothetical protein KDD47_08600 [Acidobacteria bacterium]|nr:hypothetical protein [Acidobacteriota bacterium]
MDDSKTLGLDHFRAYDLVARAVDYSVSLRGQFDRKGPRRHRLVSLEHFSNPVDKNGEGILDRQAHLDWYALDPATAAEPVRTVELANQFGTQSLTIGDAALLLVPTEKIEKGSRPPLGLDHFKCYRVLEGTTPAAASLRLEDQFLRSRRVRLEIPLFFCVPVTKEYRKGIEEIHNPKAHLTIYRISPREHATKRKVRDQFDEYALSILSTAMLAVPTRKLRWAEV